MSSDLRRAMIVLLDYQPHHAQEKTTDANRQCEHGAYGQMQHGFHAALAPLRALLLAVEIR
jgi:hypothetical protein